MKCRRTADAKQAVQGVSEASERPGFFKRILEANVSGIAKAYAAAESLFGQLQVRHLFEKITCQLLA